MRHDERLVEREVELEVLAVAVDKALRRVGSFVVVEGEAGVGKSRLLAEAMRSARSAGVRVLSARGVDLERQFGFGVMRQLFEPVLAEASPEERARLLSDAAALAGTLLAPVASLEGTEEAAGELAMLHGLYWLIANLAQDGPAVLVVDDLQWADSSSLRFLVFLLPRLSDLGVAVVAATRPSEPDTFQRLLDLLLSDPVTVLLRPRALSEPAIATLLADGAVDADSAFVRAFHEATGGNPLLVSQLVTMLRAEGVPPTAEAVEKLAVIGPRAIGRWVSHRLHALSPDTLKVARAAAVLGDSAQARDIGALASLPTEAVTSAISILDRINILQPSRPTGSRIEFVHPLVRAAIYEASDTAERAAGHDSAARVLARRRAGPEQIAAHLLLAPWAGDEWTVSVLRSAARVSLAHGSPQSAFAYLCRCIQEPPASGDLLEVLVEAGTVGQLVDMAQAAPLLERALRMADGRRRAEIAAQYGVCLIYAGNADGAGRVMEAAIGELEDDDVDLAYRMEAWLMSMRIGFAIGDPGPALAAAARLGSVPPQPTLGGRMLDCAIAWSETYAGNPAAVQRARRGLMDDLLVSHAEMLATCAWFTLAAADADELIDLLDGALEWIRRKGELAGQAGAFTYRGLAWLGRGHLAEAEADLREALQAGKLVGMGITEYLTASWLIEVLLEQGRREEAEAVSCRPQLPDPLPLSGPAHFVLLTRARVLRTDGRNEEALDLCLAAGTYYGTLGGVNPAILPWRSEAALCLQALGRPEEAVRLAAEEVEQARRWRAPRALGRALRVAGTLAAGEEAEALLREAVAVLEPSPARLEHAKALVALGACLRIAGKRPEARACLRAGAGLAEACGAAPLVELARGELSASGVRAGVVPAKGRSMLTPSELRVAGLAADGVSNREIAQILFVSPRTVEQHLGSVYRKLGISSREALPAALEASS
ncbi:ATP-binding protein [Microbispora sp. ATCC PTA-5024]|uniref:ATP-binding protein n=1 Tax=Microbispora sp. ATCC PTA-5024 TaxID=316330 RepID=UPI0003DBE7BA|nr:LuxR family transcriptional regulator [Microbispora sp. ATCC PTA-5024]ETK32810.1 hypothetical protein MPTA5024_27845 [Microbispora sp. ATCC PTA-5024]